MRRELFNLLEFHKGRRYHVRLGDSLWEAHWGKNGGKSWRWVSNGMSIVVTGTLPTLSRNDAEECIRQNGGTAASSVSKKTAFVVAGEKAGSKLTKAESLGIEIIDEAEFLRRCAR